MFGKFNFFTFLKILFRLIVTLVVIAVFAIFGWRFITGIVPGELEVLTPNEALLKAYEEKGESLVLYTQSQNSITRAEDSYGYFASCQVIFIPEAEQVQLLIRYNDSTLEATERDYELPEGSLDPEKDWYDVTLVVSRDLTPENDEDNLGNDPACVSFTRVYPTEVSERLHKGLYNYRRFVFDGVTMDDLTNAVYVDFYFVEDMFYLGEEFDVYNDRAYATLCLYAFTEKKEMLSLTDEDILALEEFQRTEK